jgi:predicted permease
MSSLRRLFRFSVRSRREIAADVNDEISFHFEMRVRELMDLGWSRDAAWREARRRFGDVSTTAAYCRQLDVEREHGRRLRGYVAELWQDIEYGFRLLYRQPGHSIVALLTIAVGIGATTLVFSVVHASLLAPLPYAHPERLMVVRLSLPDYADLRAGTDVFEDSGVFASNLYLIGDEQVLGGVVSPGFFSTLGVAPIAGRSIEPRDGAAPVVVLGHALWQRRFGADPRVIGTTLVLQGTAHTVIGVMPPRFQFPTRQFELWANMEFSMTVVPQQSQNRALRIFRAVGRLRPDVTQSQAQGQLSALAERLAAEHPDTNARVGLTLMPVEEQLVGDVRTSLLIALASVACLLFIACANVASLTLARMTTRTQELAVRAAIGAGRWRIARQLATESLLLATLGGAAGIALAWLGLSSLPGLIGDRIPRVDDVSLRVPVLLVALTAIVVSGLLVAAVPVVQLSIVQIEPALKGGSRGGEMRLGIRLRSALVVAQLTVAVVVLSGALVLTRSFIRLLSVDPGFDAAHLLTFNMVLVQQPTPGARAQIAARVLESIAAIPGVEAAGGATGLAPITAQRGTTFEIEGQPDAPIDQRRAYFIAASPGYFKAMGTPLVAGREFTSSDAAGAPKVAVISQTVARLFFPDGNALGRQLRLVNPEQSNEWRTIVGVAADVRYQGLDDANPPAVYTPFAQTPFPWTYVHVRTRGEPAALIGAVRAAVKRIDERLAVANPQPMSNLIAQSSADPRFRTMLVSLFAGVALLLSAIGLHGVIAFAVARRAREIAIRVALGASAGSVRRRVMGQALVLAATGVGLGLVGAYWAAGVLSGMLYETAPTDSVALASVAVLLLIVALVASIFPARRATRIQPVDALREV